MTSNLVLAFRSLAAALAFVFAAACIAQGAELPPSYRLHFLGDGSPSAINETGLVVGARLVGGSTYAPLVSEDGAPWTPLPFPAGAANAFPTDVNEADVIIGVSFDASFVGTAVRWMRSGAGWTVEVLPRLPGDPSSYASAINDRGEIVGARDAGLRARPPAGLALQRRIRTDRSRRDVRLGRRPGRHQQRRSPGRWRGAAGSRDGNARVRPAPARPTTRPSRPVPSTTTA